METLLTILIITIILLFAIVITVLIYFVAYITKNTVIEDVPSILYIKDIDGDNIININEIEQITQRYNTNENRYEIIYYLKSGHELKESFELDEGIFCKERFNNIYKILNDLN